MKRDKIENWNTLKKFFSLRDWKTCSKCEKEFRAEKGWQAIISPYEGKLGVALYICKECAPSQAEAMTYFVNEEYKPDDNSTDEADQESVTEQTEDEAVQRTEGTENDRDGIWQVDHKGNKQN